jgi:nucleoside transporter
MNSAIRIRLSIMMFLEYMIWGSWLAQMPTYLGKDYLNFGPFELGWVLNTFAIASLTGMIFGGQLADRYFAQERFLAFSHLVGGLSMIGLAFTKSFWPIFGLMMLHCFFYVPTLSVTNVISFANLKDSQKEFGFIRVFGTLGWIAASLPFLVLPLTSMFYLAGGISLALAAFCLTLPHTPPARVEGEGRGFAPLEAVKVLAVPSILVLFIVTLIDAVVHTCYFVWTGEYFKSLGIPENWVFFAMTVSQIAEILTMAFLGFFLKRLGWRTTMLLGILGQAIRFGIYSIGTPQTFWLVVLGNVAHGFAYAFFFATVYIFVDESFPKDVRTSAQSLFNLLILGLGPFIGNFLWPWLGKSVFVAKVLVDGKPVLEPVFHQLFLVPLALGLIGTAIMAFFFWPPSNKEPIPEEVPVLVH